MPVKQAQHGGHRVATITEFPRIARPVSIFARSLLVSGDACGGRQIGGGNCVRVGGIGHHDGHAERTRSRHVSRRGLLVDHGYPFARGPQLFNNADTNTTQPNHDVVVAHGPCALGTEGRGNPSTDQ